MNRLKTWLLACCMGALAMHAHASITTGSAAPDFTATDEITKKEFSLADFKGKTVVLEWVNYGCPFVKKHYGAGNMQALQQAAADNGVVWISINSGAEGKQGFLKADEVAPTMKEHDAKNAHYVRDADGKIGKLYNAKTTPHMFIINAEGTLVYQGAIDDNSSADASTIKGATNYVTETLAALKAGTPVSVGTTQPYGCSVKYGS